MMIWQKREVLEARVAAWKREVEKDRYVQLAMIIRKKIGDQNDA